MELIHQLNCKDCEFDSESGATVVKSSRVLGEKRDRLDDVAEFRRAWTLLTEPSRISNIFRVFLGSSDFWTFRRRCNRQNELS